MHEIQTALLQIANQKNLGKLSLGDMARLLQEQLGYKVHRQQVKHHFEQLVKKNLLTGSKQTGDVRPFVGGASGLLFTLPIMGNANCGEAMELAEDKVQEYVQLSKRLIHVDSPVKLKRIFGVRAVGESMNDAKIGSGNLAINDGDLVLADPKYGSDVDGKYMVTVIDGAANIKRVMRDVKNQRVILRSQSTNKYPDIYLHEDDLEHVFFAGEVVDVIKA